MKLILNILIIQAHCSTYCYFVNFISHVGNSMCYVYVNIQSGCMFHTKINIELLNVNTEHQKQVTTMTDIYIVTSLFVTV